MTREVGAYSIGDNEFEQRRHVFEFWAWINQKLAEMEDSADFERLYLEKKDPGPDGKLNRNVKKFLEKAIPVARLGLHFVRPGYDVFVQCHAGSQHHDATLEVEGASVLRLHVEVTTAELEDAYLRREALSRYGFVYGSGPIRRVSPGKSGEIESEAEMTNVPEEQTRWVEKAFAAVRVKLDKGYDGPDTAILVRLNPCFRWDFRYRADLVLRTRELLDDRALNPYAVYFLCENGNLLDSVRPRPTTPRPPASKAGEAPNRPVNPASVRSLVGIPAAPLGTRPIMTISQGPRGVAAERVAPAPCRLGGPRPGPEWPRPVRLA